MRKIRLVGYGLALLLLACTLSAWWWTHRPYAVARRAYDEIKVGMSKEEVENVFAKWGATDRASGDGYLVYGEATAFDGRATRPARPRFRWIPGGPENLLGVVERKYYIVCCLPDDTVSEKYMFYVTLAESPLDKIRRWLRL